MGRPGTAVAGAGHHGRCTAPRHRFVDRIGTPFYAVVLLVSLAMVSAACGSDLDTGAAVDSADGADPASGSSDSEAVRSSGELAFTDDEESAELSEPVVPIVPPAAPTLGDELSAESDTPPEPAGDDTALPSTVPVPRADGIELVYQDGALGPARLGTTIDQMIAALGPQYRSEPEPVVRSDFPAGHAVIKDGAVVFWAIEQDGVIVTVMSVNPLVGLDSGLRPTLPLEQAVTIHGAVALNLGPANREFAAFEDGVGSNDVAVLVAIGQFGGPVGSYAVGGPGESETTEFSAGANIKELWFHLDPTTAAGSTSADLGDPSGAEADGGGDESSG